MKWEKYIRGMLAGGECVEIKSLRVPDESGGRRRYRVCSTEAHHDRFTARPARGRLVKSPEGRIGVVIQPRGAGFVKVGRRLSVQPVVFTSLDSISKKSAEKLLKQIDCTVYESEGACEAFEE